MNKNSFDIGGVCFDIYSDASVFGDGTHETTQNLLKYLQQQELEGREVIDLGTGTGILSVYAAKRGANVLALDISGATLEWARKNFKRNDVQVEIEINDVLQYIDRKADVIVSNLPPAEQSQALYTAKNNLTEDGVFIISWLKQLELERFTRDFDVADHVEGEVYDAYVLKRKKEAKKVQ